MEFLVENGADVNKANKHGKTPLSIAREKEHFEIAKYQAKHGADINMEILRKSIYKNIVNYCDIVQILRDAGARE